MSDLYVCYINLFKLSLRAWKVQREGRDERERVREQDGEIVWKNLAEDREG